MLGNAKPLLYTPGDPAGIGPELILQYAATHDLGDLWVVANTQMMQQRAACLGLSCDTLNIIDIPMPAKAVPGKLDVNNVPYVLACIDKAMDLCQSGEAKAMVTGPIHKGIINEAGILFSGHTEYLAQRAHVPEVVMMLVNDHLRVALVTTHIPLAQVSSNITQDKLMRVLQITHQDLTNKFALPNPKIAVCGLNPHAGESGHLGDEERLVIEPVITKCQQNNMNITGPLSADTLYVPHHAQHFDAIVAMYHDQGLPVVKTVGFHNTVNITLGLPFIRTSVDHGTALNLAGTGTAHTGSLAKAIELAHAAHA